MASLGTATPDMPDPGVYRAELIAFDADRILEYKKEGKDVREEKWELTWHLLTYADGEAIDGPTEYKQLVNRKLGTKSTMYAVTSALWARAPERGEEIDTDDLIGKQAMLTLEEYTKLSGDTGIKVGGIAPLRRKKAPLQATPPKPAAEPEEAFAF